MKGKWYWRGDVLKYSVDGVDVFKVDCIPHTGQPYCARRVSAELSETEQEQLTEEGLERYMKGPK